MSAQSLPVFCSRLKTHLFSHSFRWLYCCACEVTLVITDTLIAVLTYLLTYLLSLLLCYSCRWCCLDDCGWSTCTCTWEWSDWKSGDEWRWDMADHWSDHWHCWSCSHWRLCGPCNMHVSMSILFSLLSLNFYVASSLVKRRHFLLTSFTVQSPCVCARTWWRIAAILVWGVIFGL